MRFFGLLASAASLLVSYVSAQNGPLAITAPLGGTFAAGTKVTITWAPTTASSVTLQLRYGSNSGNLATGAPIASNVPNTGSFTWTVPADIASTSYAIQITDSSGVTNFSPPFSVSGGTGSITSSASSTSASASSSSSAKSSSSASSSGSSTTSKSSSSTGTSSTTSSASAQTSTKAPSSGGMKAGAGGGIAAIFGLGALVAMV